jgi:hypothetical protein
MFGLRYLVLVVRPGAGWRGEERRGKEVGWGRFVNGRLVLCRLICSTQRKGANNNAVLVKISLFGR